MFRVTFFCEDKRLGNALRALAGLAHGNPEVLPVVNVEANGKQLKARTNGKARDQLVDWMKQKHLTEVQCAHAKEFLRTAGMSENSATYVLKDAVAAGLLKRFGKGTKSSYRLK